MAVNSTKRKSAVSSADIAIWCHRCSIRIAPYDKRTIKKGKTYHQNCYTKMVADATGRR